MAGRGCGAWVVSGMAREWGTQIPNRREMGSSCTDVEGNRPCRHDAPRRISLRHSQAFPSPITHHLWSAGDQLKSGRVRRCRSFEDMRNRVLSRRHVVPPLRRAKVGACCGPPPSLAARPALEVRPETPGPGRNLASRRRGRGRISRIKTRALRTHARAGVRLSRLRADHG